MYISRINSYTPFYGKKSKVQTPTRFSPITQKASTIWNTLKGADNIVILSHKYPDGDAMGAGLALVNTLKEKFPNKQVKFLVPGGVSEKFSKIPGANLIVRNYSFQEPFIAIAVDCDETVLDGLDIYKKANTRINIDHHSTNIHVNQEQRLNDLFLIDINSASTTDILYNKFFKILGINISNETAECLLTGIVTDTGRFRYGKNIESAKKTSENLLNILNKTGRFTLSNIYSKFAQYQETDELNAFGKHFLNKTNTIMTDLGKKINYLIIKQSDLKSFGVKSPESDIKEKIKHLVKNLSKSADAGILLFETNDKDAIKVSLRSEKINVREYAMSHSGGGGNEHAAGFMLNGALDEVIQKLLAELKAYKF